MLRELCALGLDLSTIWGPLQIWRRRVATHNHFPSPSPSEPPTICYLAHEHHLLVLVCSFLCGTCWKENTRPVLHRQLVGAQTKGWHTDQMTMILFCPPYIRRKWKVSCRLTPVFGFFFRRIAYPCWNTFMIINS